ncbi:MAG: response regulator transcription factor [Alphaproteobacteria bacterium]|nr:response regulator transcription factor [Alphaproteobacteria bacterium]MBF0130903.1 response regulator transcription factor [Alphaproteobacteria bacterium]
MRLLIADDHALFRGGLRLQLAQFDPDAQILEAGTFPEMLEISRRERPLDLAIVDLGMPGMPWREALPALGRAAPEARVVVLSGSDSPSNVREALALGAAGFIPKTDEAHIMIAALKLVMSGGTYVPSAALTDGGGDGHHPAGPVTHRQKDVLQLLAKGLSNKEIAYRLQLTEGTVKLHVAAVLRSLGATNRTQAVLAAQHAGIIEAP